MTPDLHRLLVTTEEIYLAHFSPTTCFERAIFFSWGCSIGDCTFCYMSTQPDSKKPVETKRSYASIFAEFILSKQLGWEIGFFTGGIGVFTPDEVEFMLKVAVQIIGDKLWLSVGPLSKPLLIRYLPYIKGVVGSTETINPILHKQVCPSKPLEPYQNMFVAANELGLKKAMTFIVGMGESRNDMVLLKEFIIKYKIDKIHIYGLIPQKGTPFQHSPPPTAEEQAWWIAQLRMSFPHLDIQCGIWKDRVDRIPLLLKAGANSISKFPALKEFGKQTAISLEEGCKLAGREMIGTLTKLPYCNWEQEVTRLDIDEELKKDILDKLLFYLEEMGGEKCLIQIKQ
ncbi:radical SAM protein [Candidatus Woesearchaeota archaeon]|nr:radical SAM protein [Candidatus Woesearchaeota archaeon]